MSIDFMCPFVSSYGNTYFLVVVDYVSKWVEAVALPNNEARSVVAFLKKSIFARFGTPRAIISDEGSHFCNRAFNTLLPRIILKQVVKWKFPTGKSKAYCQRRSMQIGPIGQRSWMMLYGLIGLLTRL